MPKDERTRSSEQIAMDLRRQLSGIPGVIVRANASGGNNQMNRLLSGGQQRRRPPVARDSRRETSTTRDGWRRAAKDLLDTTPGVADARLGRDEGRPELAVRVDRPKAALLGLSATHGGEHDPHQRRRHAGRDVPPGRQRVSDHRPAARGGTAERRPTSTTSGQHAERRRCCRRRT